jgi:hypothetical protein
MTADTLNEMILGFSVILGVLVVYILTLIFRWRRAGSEFERISEDQSES